MKTKSSGVGSFVTRKSYRIGTSCCLQIDWANVSDAVLSRKKWGGIEWLWWGVMLVVVGEHTSSWQLLMQKVDLSSLLVVHYSMSLKSLQDGGYVALIEDIAEKSAGFVSSKLALARTTTKVISVSYNSGAGAIINSSPMFSFISLLSSKSALSLSKSGFESASTRYI